MGQSIYFQKAKELKINNLFSFFMFCLPFRDFLQTTDVNMKRNYKSVMNFVLYFSMLVIVPVRSNRHNVMLFVPENAILLMSPLKLIVAAAVLRKSVTSIVASL